MINPCENIGKDDGGSREDGFPEEFRNVFRDDSRGFSVNYRGISFNKISRTIADKNLNRIREKGSG